MWTLTLRGRAMAAFRWIFWRKEKKKQRLACWLHLLTPPPLPSPPHLTPFSSRYESSWIKSQHYKTIRSEASGNAAGIRRSPPTVAARDGEGEERVRLAGRSVGGGGCLRDGKKGGRTARVQAWLTGAAPRPVISEKKNSVCLPSKKPSAFNVDQPASDFNVANPPPPPVDLFAKPLEISDWWWRSLDWLCFLSLLHLIDSETLVAPRAHGVRHLWTRDSLHMSIVIAASMFG